MFAMYQVSFMISAPFIANFMSRIGRKNCVIFGYLIAIVSALGFGGLSFVKASPAPACESHSLMFWLAMGIRFLQGVGEALVNTACFAVVTIEFPKDTTTYVGYLEMALGLGLTFGPALGSGFMTLFQDVFYTFLAFAFLLFLGLLSIIAGLPNSLNDPEIE